MEELKMEEYIPPSIKILFQGDKEYHVFLSFKGEDVRKNLVDHLHEALTAAGLHVFLDTHKLEKGDKIWSSLERAIRSSAIRIPIFSRGYADSAWCLREAATMVNTQGLIIPLFYDVEPTHLRYPETVWYEFKFCESLQLFSTSSHRYQREEIEGWKVALENICSRSGLSMDITGG
ncbi:hypothetical protein SUGI_1081990 [Cryptomeria japonica]|nr:hypothetical protein SUGI_1081990 [Cryptomeria japonica]